MITTYFKETISYLIDNFRTETRRHFNLSFTFAIVSGIVSMIIAALFTLVLGFIFGTFSLEHFTEDVMSFAPEYNKAYSLAYALSLLSIGLYSSFIISCMNDVRLKDKPKYAWSDLRSFISEDEWRWFWKFVAVILVVFFLSFKSLKSFYGVSMSRKQLLLADIYPESGLSAAQIFLSRLLEWIDSIIALLRTYLPYLLITFFVITVYENKLDKEILRKYRNGIWSALVIAFVINVLSATISDYFEKYIIGFIQIFLFSIASAALPTLIQITCLLILAALVNWTAAAAFCMPIKLIAEEGYEKDEEETINDDPRIIE